MKMIASQILNILKNDIIKKIIKIFDIFVSAVFFICILVAIVVALGDLFIRSSYPFASKELFLSFEIISLMILLYWISSHASKSIHRILWIFIMFKIFVLLSELPNIQKVQDYEYCYDMNYCKSSLFKDITEISCLKDSGVWNIDEKACDYSYDEASKCRKRRGNWLYPDICKK